MQQQIVQIQTYFFETYLFQHLSKCSKFKNDRIPIYYDCSQRRIFLPQRGGQLEDVGLLRFQDDDYSQDNKWLSLRKNLDSIPFDQESLNNYRILQSRCGVQVEYGLFQHRINCLYDMANQCVSAIEAVPKCWKKQQY